MKRVAVILAGCGSQDGSEIQEATLLLYALSAAEYSVQCFAFNREQAHVVNHLKGEVVEGESRNQMVESARIARGDVKEISELVVSDFDALLLPGGFGHAKNICTFAFDGLDLTVAPEVRATIEAFHSAGKPIAAMCIAPITLCATIKGVTVTLGPLGELTDSVEQRFSAKLVDVGREGVAVDSENRVLTTASYMFGDSTIANIGRGAEALVAKLTEML